MPREVCVALGGGGARGLAHIGVLAELEQAGYRIAALAGTSMGGVIAALYASGLSPVDMAAFAAGSLGTGLFHFQPSPGGLLGIGRIRDALAAALQGKSFADARCPLALTAVDLDLGTDAILTSGELIDPSGLTRPLPRATIRWQLWPPTFSSVAVKFSPSLPVTLRMPACGSRFSLTGLK